MEDKFDIFNGNLNLELSDDSERAIITIPLINSGSNKKHINWKPNVLSEIVHMFKGVVFKNDVNGTNDSSHVTKHLFSPHYDVGWTYKDERGAWFDGRTLWVRGEVTHPETIQKLKRKTSDGQREINAGSSGVILNWDHCECSICQKSPFGTCKHERGKEYNGIICDIIPLSAQAVTKVLHTALTNDPADGDAFIANAIFQDCSVKDIEEKNKGDTKMSEEDKKIEEEVTEEELNDEETTEEESVEEIETAADDGKRTIKCPKCSHAIVLSSQGMVMPAAKANTNNVPTENSFPKSKEIEPSNKANRKAMADIGGARIESADNSQIVGELKARIVSNIENHSKRLGRQMLETADMSLDNLKIVEKILVTTPSPAKESNMRFESADLSGIGAPVENTQVDKLEEFNKMSAEQRYDKYGPVNQFAMALGGKEIEIPKNSLLRLYTKNKEGAY